LNMSLYERPREKTEWEDVLVKHKIMTASKKHVTQDELDFAHMERANQKDKLADKSLGELDELEDDEDKDTLDVYRKKRIAEMRKNAKLNKFGDLMQINESEYKKEVTEASAEGEDGTYVVLHLFCYGKRECRLMNQCLVKLAKKIRYVKFRKIVAGECIHGYPDSECPTIIIYYKGDILKKITGLVHFGGLKTNVKTIEWKLTEWGVCRKTMEQNPFEEISRTNIKKLQQRKGYLGNDDSDSDDFFN